MISAVTFAAYLGRSVSTSVGILGRLDLGAAKRCLRRPVIGNAATLRITEALFARV